MSVTIGEMIDRVQSDYSKGVSSDDARLSKRHIYSALRSGRSFLVTQQVRKRQKISNWNFITLPCVELIKVPAHNCPCLPSKGCEVYRTKYKLPKVLTDLNKHLIDWVMTVDNNIRINETTRKDYLYDSGNKYTAGRLKYILEDGYIFVYGKNIPKLIAISLLAEDPIEAYKFPSYCQEDCTDCQDCTPVYDNIFPIDNDLVDSLIRMVNLELIKEFNRFSQEDQSNNSADSIREQSK